MLKPIKRLVLLATVIAAIIPAAAYARPILPDSQPYSVSAATLQAISPTAARQVSASSGQGFSWHDAGFGAAATLVLVAVGTGAAVALRRRAILG